MRSSSPSVPRWIRPLPAPATTPPRLTGPWAPLDTRLDEVERFPLPSGAGPEDVAVDPADRPVSGDSLGHLWRWSADPRPGQPPELFADTGGRPLGIEVDPRDGTLVVCDSFRGLLRVTDDGVVTELCTEAAGRPLRLCNNAAVARDGTVFFTDSSDRYPVTHYKRDLLEHRPNGRLLAYRPAGVPGQRERDRRGHVLDRAAEPTDGAARAPAPVSAAAPARGVRTRSPPAPAGAPHDGGAGKRRRYGAADPARPGRAVPHGDRRTPARRRAVAGKPGRTRHREGAAVA